MCCRYVGGYYGACSEAEMMQEIYTHGPVAVGIEVYPDLLNYRCACVTRVVCDDV